MTTDRQIVKTVKGRRAQDGAGVSLVRVLGNETIYDFDPILMLDSFDSTNPEDFSAGFPTHPHRGIEIVTFLAEGSVRHKDNLGHEAVVGDGGAQWLTAGSGAFHSEYMSATDRLLGVQLWLNLPRKDKMCPPAYHSIESHDIQEFPFDGGRLRLICGEYRGHRGYQGKYLPLDYYDIILDPHATLTIDTASEASVMAFMLQGKAVIGGDRVEEKTAVKLGDGDRLTISAADHGAEVLVMISRKLDEPVAWYGPIVMNTMGEIKTAVRELNEGTFLKSKTNYRE
ncbi:MAG: pirin family protein [Prevotella sp.]|nr:pirin family protein [Prevotella sp.]